VLGGTPKGKHDGLAGGAVVRAGTDVTEREVSTTIEDEITAQSSVKTRGSGERDY